MSRNIGFHYAGGVTSGIALAAFVALFMLARLLPMKRNMLLSIWAGGSSLLMWAGTRFQARGLRLFLNFVEFDRVFEFDRIWQKTKNEEKLMIKYKLYCITPII